MLCLRASSSEVQYFEGVLPGFIATSEKGGGGFGYDPLFVPDGYDGLSLAELKERDILVKTHRYLAFAALCNALKK